MGAVVKHDYAEDIRKRHFKEIADLVRKGDISALDEAARNLLADYLEGKLKPRTRGRPRLDNPMIAEGLYEEFRNIKRTGMTKLELSEYVLKDETGEGAKKLFSPNARDKKTRHDAIAYLADTEGMGFDNVERHIEYWESYIKHKEEET